MAVNKDTTQKDLLNRSKVDFAGFDLDQVMPKLGLEKATNLEEVRKFLEGNPAAARKLDKWGTIASKMVRGEPVDTVFRSQVSTPNLVDSKRTPQQTPRQNTAAINNPSQSPALQMQEGGSVPEAVTTGQTPAIPPSCILAT